MIKALLAFALIAAVFASGCTSSPAPAAPQDQPPQIQQQPADVLNQDLNTIPDDNVTGLEEDLTGALLAQ